MIPGPPPPAPPPPPPAPSGTIYFDGRARRMESLYSYEDVYGDRNTWHREQKPVLWDGLNFLFSNVGRGIALAPDARYGQVFKVTTKIGDSDPFQPPGSFLSANKGAGQVTKRRSNNLGKWDWYAMSSKVPSWSGSPSSLQWFDLASLAYQTSRGDQFAFRLAYDPNSPTKLSYAVSANVGHAVDPNLFNADRAWQAKLLPLVFNRWDEWVFGIRNATDDTGQVQVYHRVPGGSWAKVLDRQNTPTYIWGTTSYGTFNRDGSNWGTVLDKIGAYYGRYPGSILETVYESGIVRCSDRATAASTFPA